MTKKILIDAHHPEETRVAILENNNLDKYTLADYEFEVRSKDELKGNIYLAKITKIESSLQAAFVDYGEKRQGFLPFDEVNIKYFNLSEEQRLEIEEKQLSYREELKQKRKEKINVSVKNTPLIKDTNIEQNESVSDINNDLEKAYNEYNNAESNFNNTETDTIEEDDDDDEDFIDEETFLKQVELENSSYGTRYGYKIQDVLSTGQYILVQVIKEERGNKGAALTSYISIPGRYCVLMPYTPFQISISKKIRNKVDRKRLKDLIKSLDVNKSNNLIIRTASLEKTDEEIIQDYNYVLGMWTLVEKHSRTYKKPCLLVEEGSVIKKIIRDLYSENVLEIVIQGTKAYNTAKLYANALAPEALNKIIKFDNPKMSLFKYYNLEDEINSIYSPVVFLKSGGYIVINSTEALVAIDVNSGRSKGKQNVEETAIKTNTEAAVEIMKQIKLRDIGGLIIIDFIDMENIRNRASIEKRIKDLAREDKAKMAIAPISQFGLLEISRQRIKASLAEKIFHVCPKCYGVGYVKPLELNALTILRNLRSDVEHEKIEVNNSTSITILMPSNEAFYLLNNKRHELVQLEEMLGTAINIEYSDDIGYPFYKIQDTVLENNNNQPLLFLEQELEANLQKYKLSLNKKQPVKEFNTHNNNQPKKSINNKPTQPGWFKKILYKLK